MRRALIAAACLLAWVRPASAQQCHSMSTSSWRTPGVFVGVRFDAAGYRNFSYEGDYQGLAPVLSYNHRRFSLMAMQPVYRLTRNGLATYGLGDLLLAFRVPIQRWSRDHFTAGFGMATTLPTGDASRDLGMGHVMPMPEFWWANDFGRVVLLGNVGFARALAGSGGGGHHHGSGNNPHPIVNPMNMSEAEGALTALVQMHRLVWLKMGAYAAMPLGTADTPGITRVILTQGMSLTVRGLELGLDIQVPLAGAPFLARGVLQVGYRFDIKPRRRRMRP
ncbi:hypothetical protein [Nannocystis radixulma]|uniref:Uncharacterized protein n=1 Tax=Nannocystis radixulma TaxID=2995305 RepID=A0ABT5BLA2_9BACT|nr:hypothetical protein [Nannocystis radixulma]MDC0673731.1 hypothetical protein [Nannocystis radixulma]